MPDDAGHTFEAITSLRASNRALLEELADLDEMNLPEAFLSRIDAFREQARQAGAYLSAPIERAEAQSILNFWLTVRYVSGQQAASMLLDEFDHAGAQERAAGASPYKGLEAFQIRDRDRFFGRQSAVSEILDKLAHVRLVAVTGLSGSGKSSIVRAGLIPALMDGAIEGSNTWRFLDPMVPGSDPLAALEATLADAKLAQGPIESAAQLTEALDRAGAPVVLSVDQFEETFTIAGPGPRRTLFLNAIMHAAGHGAHRHVVIITMRSEFSVYVEQHAELDAAFKAGGVLVGAILGPGLRLAIEQPAGQLGIRFEAGLVEELLHSVLGEPAGLPLLQFTLLDLWNNRDGDLITTQLYKDLGGSPRDILAKRAAEVFDGFATESDRILTRRIFGRLVQIGSGLDATSRRVHRRDLDEIRVGPGPNVDYVLDRWRKSGLIRISPPGDIKPTSVVEVAHEALIRNWRQLVEWIELDFAKSRQRVLLMERARGWKNGTEGLLPELSLKEAESYQGLEPLEADYVKASRKKVNEDYRRRRWIWRGAVAAGVMGLVLLVYGFLATAKGLEAERGAVDARTIAAGERARAADARAELQRSQAALKRSQAAVYAAQMAEKTFYTEAEAASERLRAAKKAGAEAQRALAAMEPEARRRKGELLELSAQRASLAQQITASAAELAATRRQYTVAQAQAVEEKARADDNESAYEAVVTERLEQRPVVAVRNGRLERVPSEWGALDARRETVDRIAASVGRVSFLSGAMSTGFVIADGVVLAFEAGDDAQAQSIDFADKPDGATNRFLVLRRLRRISISGGAFLAVLQVEKRNAAGASLPGSAPLRFAAGSALKSGLLLTMVGMPAPNGGDATDLQGRILNIGDGAKRVSPGFLLSWDRTEFGRVRLAYDLTSFSGSAGGPVIDLETGRVIGVHFATDVRSGKDRAQMRNFGIALEPDMLPSDSLRGAAPP